jgi:hypothetical protein
MPSLFGFGSKKKEEPAKKKGPSLFEQAGTPSPLVYRERSANNFQEEELNRLRNSGGQPTQRPVYRERVVGVPSAAASSPAATNSSPQTAAKPDSGDDGQRDRQFDMLKKQLATALQDGDSDRIIEGYRNLGQHFMSGKTIAEQQAAKQMFEKALEHAGLSNSSKVSSPAVNPPPAPPPPAHEQDAPPSSPPHDNADFVPTGWTRKTVELARALLPGMPPAQDGLAGVGISFDTTPAGIHVISSLAPTGSAAQSGKILPGDVLKSVDGKETFGLSPMQVITLVKGVPGSRLVLVLDSSQPQPLPPPSSPPQAPASPTSADHANQTSHTGSSGLTSSPVYHPQQAEEAEPPQTQDLQGMRAPKPSPPPKSPGQQQQQQTDQQLMPATNEHRVADPIQQQPQQEAKEYWNQGQQHIQVQQQTMEEQPTQQLPYQAAPQHPHDQQPANDTPWFRKEVASPAQPMVDRPIPLPPEPGEPAPQNPVIGGNTPGRQVLPHTNVHQAPSTAASGNGHQNLPSSRRRGKRLVFSREPPKGQVVLPEQPVGIGLNLSSSERGGAPFVVDSLLPGSPAANCGQVSPGDVVYSIDGTRVKDKSLPEVIQMLKGPTGTQVTLVFLLSDNQVVKSSGERSSSLQVFEAKLDLIAAEGLPTSSVSETGLCDPFICVSLLPESIDMDASSSLVMNHKRHSQANSKTCRKTLNPVWKETHVIRSMHTDSVVDDSNRALPSAHERSPLCGQGFTVMLTVHSETGGDVGGEDFIGCAFLRNCRPGPSAEYRLPLVDTHGRAVGFSGQAAMVHVRLTYGPVQGDIHQTEAARKAAEMAASRKRREESGEVLLNSNNSVASRASPHMNSQSLKGLSSGEILQTPAPTANGVIYDHEGVGSPPSGLASLWMQAYANKTPSATQREGDVQTDVLAFVPPASLMSTPNGTHYGDKRSRGFDSLGGTPANFNASMLEQIRLEMEIKDKALVTLRTEHARLRERFSQLSSMNDDSVHSSAATLMRLKSELQSKNDEARELQDLVNDNKHKLERMEQQLNSAQELVRGSLLQHERYEATTEQQLREIAQLKREKERAERELQALQSEHLDLPTGNGTQSLNELIEYERRRFKKALADERARSAEALEKQRNEMEKELQYAKEQSKREASRAFIESTMKLDSNDTPNHQALLHELQSMRNSLTKEREISEKTFRDLQQEITHLRRQAANVSNDEKNVLSQSTIVKDWYSPGAPPDSAPASKITRLEAAVAKMQEERDYWRRRDAEARRQLDEREAASVESQISHTVSQTVREKERAVEELRDVELDLEKVKSQRDKLHQRVSELMNEKEELQRKLEKLENSVKVVDTTVSQGSSNATVKELEETREKLRERDKAFVKLQKEHKRLQIMAAGRSPAALRTPTVF